MTRLVIWCVVLFCAPPLLVMAAGESLGDQIAAINKKITAEQELNIDLKLQLTAKETAVAEAKVTLKELEDQIDTLKKEHHFESK